MALVRGTNCGFVTVAPTADPASINAAQDLAARAFKDAAPTGATTITEIGWWCDTAGTPDVNFEVGLYSHDAGDVPLTRLFVSATNAKGTTAGWKTVAVNWAITAGTTYWIAVQLDNTTPNTAIDYTSAAGTGLSIDTASTTLITPWVSDGMSGGLLAIYALVSAAYVDIAATIAGTGAISGTLTYQTQKLLAATISGTGAISGTLTLSSDWNVDFPFKTIKRLTAVGNGSFYYEAI
jgi:hypothetical protein